MIHNNASATAVKSLGADLRPNGSALSASSSPLHHIPRSRRSSGWTGMMRYALAMSNLASSDPFPRLMTHLTASSTDAYDTEHRLGKTPSFTLPPLGDDRSVMSLHFPGWWGLGITSMRLICSIDADVGV